MKICFQKTGREIKAAITNRRQQLQQRLDNRNGLLDEFLKDSQKVRSYMVRSMEAYRGGHGNYPAPLYGKDDISSEEREEISKLCQRISEIEQEIRRLEMIATHLTENQTFELTLEELTFYGFEANI